MSTATIKQKLHRYIETAEIKKLKAIYTIVEDEIETASTESEVSLQELNQRVADFESGKVKGVSWGEVKQQARKSLSKK